MIAEKDFDPEKNYLTPTHKLTLDVGVAYIKYYDSEYSGPDRVWNREEITIVFYKGGKTTLSDAVHKKVKEKFPESVGAFHFPPNWEKAIRIAPDPVLPDVCGCLLGTGGGIYQPDLWLDIRFGYAQFWSKETTDQGIWFDQILTVQACSNRNDLDANYLMAVKNQHHWKEDIVGFFIVERMWDRARKLEYDYEQQHNTVGPLAGLPKDHDPSPKHDH